MAHVRIVAQIGRMAAEDDARLASRFQGSPPNRGNGAFIAFAKSLLGVANEQADVLIRGGVLRTQLAAFVEDLAEFEKALDEATVLGRERARPATPCRTRSPISASSCAGSICRRARGSRGTRA